MKNLNLLLVVLCSLCSALAVNSLRSKTHVQLTPTEYYMDITPIPGIGATDVGVGADGTMWVISNETYGGGDYNIYRQKAGSTEWEKIDGHAKRISVARDGNAWLVQNDHDIFRYNGAGWTQVHGDAWDISCSPEGNVYHIGASSTFYMLNSGGKDWSQISGNGVVIAGGMSRSIWAITPDGRIFIHNAVKWEQLGTGGVDIACSQNGLTWVLTKAAWPNQFAVYDALKQDWIYPNVSDYLDKSGPTSISSSPTTRIAAAPNGDLIGVKQDGSLFRMRFNWGDN